MSVPSASSGSYGLLAPAIQRWIYRQGWGALRDIQEQAIPPVLEGKRDVLISSGTASGKTEAAFIPIASALADRAPEGIAVLCVSPLKALINDQHRRLEEIFEEVKVPVHRWHGDVSQSKRRDVLAGRGGVLLITPESLEAMFVRRGHHVPRLFAGLRYTVVDEFHAFIGSERGQQLQSLLHRMETAIRRRVPRLALSATLGDLGLACELLRPGHAADVVRIVSDANRQDVHLQVRGYRVGQATGRDGEAALVDDLFRMLRGGRHLVFANQRADVERLADALRVRCEALHVPNEFWPHHGSLDRGLREDAEAALRAQDRPASVIATSTLELGIDVGAVESVAQVGRPHAVASMRQRLGRAGRRGSPAVLRIIIREKVLRPDSADMDRLRTGIVQSVAMVRLLARRWYEPPPVGALHLSTLIQQVLSLVAQHGEIRADQAWRLLCASGPFRGVDAATFARLLRDLGRAELVSQVNTGALVLGGRGEQVVNAHDFYAAFQSPEEFRLVAQGRTLGTVPVLTPLSPDAVLVFAGRRWRVLVVDDLTKVVELAPAAGGAPPVFGGDAAEVHDRVREEMRSIYMADDEPAFLSAEGKELLAEGRAGFRSMHLDHRCILPTAGGTLWFPWVGDRVLNTLKLQFRAWGLGAEIEGCALLTEAASPELLADAIVDLAELGPADGLSLAAGVENKRLEKHHGWLSDELLALDYASSRLDVANAHRALARAALEMHPTSAGPRRTPETARRGR